MHRKKIGNFSVVQLLGCGGVGCVYKALGPAGELVAIKILNSAGQNCKETRERFQREFDVARKLVHPHIVRYLDFGAEGGLQFIVMEYAEGVSLWEHVRSHGPMKEADVVRVAGQIASALDAAHKMNVLHRDVKPNNVLLIPTGKAKLMDFGLAKDLEAAGNLTAVNATLGTPFFMAPEQFYNTKTVDSHADVYGLAATLLYALTGRLPFKFRGVGLLEKKLAGLFHPPGEIIPNVSEGTIQAVVAGLSPEPGQRPETALKLVNAMRAAAKKRSKLGHNPALTDWAEKRAVLRRTCEFEGSGRLPGDACEYAVRITDISTQGLCMLTGRRLPPDSLLGLSFSFSDADDRWDYQIRVVHAANGESQPWRHGCRFVQPMERAELLALLGEDREKVRVRVSSSA
jgi:serine/threonine protein kinase